LPATLKTVIAIIMAAGTLLAASPSYCSNAAMKGPPAVVSHNHHTDYDPDPSPFKLLIMGAITLYRNFISPTQGPRCGFFPTCSTFGLQAVREYGPLQGVMMTTDRLTRCNVLKGPGSDYYLLPNGKLFDPVTNNLLVEP
jgi:putative membrane protein insertion efficiency factor